MNHDTRAPSARDRAPYDPIVGRKPFTLPGKARVAVWTIVNVENWLPENAMPRTVLSAPMGQPLLPDVANWCWHEYGMRVGFWRFLEVLQRRGLRATLAVNGSACKEYAPACQAALDAGWEFMGHGFVQKPLHRVENQADSIRQTMDAIRSFTGHPPRGWESPGIAQTEDTVDLLAAAGIEYVADWVLDDQPVPIQTRSGPIVSVPYSVEINDVVIASLQHHASDELLRRGVDQFDQLYKEGATVPRVMAISIHPYLTGVPHRIKYLERLYDHIQSFPDVLMCTGGEIFDIFRQQNPTR